MNHQNKIVISVYLMQLMSRGRHFYIMCLTLIHLKNIRTVGVHQCIIYVPPIMYIPGILYGYYMVIKFDLIELIQ